MRTLQRPRLHLLQRRKREPMATVDVAVTIADLEPVAGFIAKACRAEAWLRQLTADQADDLPDVAVAAMSMLQEAVREIGGYLPTAAAILAGSDNTTETRTRD
jgi:hypothetical protein